MGPQGVTGPQGPAGVGMTDDSVGDYCEVNSTPGVFDWYEVSPGLYMMVCDVNSN
jgi:hypothetical protein